MSLTPTIYQSTDPGAPQLSGTVGSLIALLRAVLVNLPNAEQRLTCIGDATPIPDWDLYLQDPGAVPDVCADGGTGAGDPFSLRAPTVTLIDPDQSLPSSLRLDLGYRTQLPKNFTANERLLPPSSDSSRKKTRTPAISGRSLRIFLRSSER